MGIGTPATVGRTRARFALTVVAIGANLGRTISAYALSLEPGRYSPPYGRWANGAQSAAEMVAKVAGDTGGSVLLAALLLGLVVLGLLAWARRS